MRQLKENSVNKTGTHNYELQVYTINGGLKPTETSLNIELVRGSSVDGENKIPKQDGVLIEQLLWVSLEYLESVNVGDLRSRDTSIAITHIEDALLRVNKRTQDRKARGVLTTYKK